MESWGIPFVTFLVGVATGSAGTYMAHKFTDQRREQEKNRKAKQAFSKVKEQMPDLIAEMKEDFLKRKNDAIREFMICPHDRVTINSPQPRFYYYENKHPNLKGKVNVLQNHGYLQDVTVSNAPIFRMSEEFWDLVLHS